MGNVFYVVISDKGYQYETQETLPFNDRSRKADHLGQANPRIRRIDLAGVITTVAGHRRHPGGQAIEDLSIAGVDLAVAHRADVEQQVASAALPP
jgi:hypothetical protein